MSRAHTKTAPACARADRTWRNPPIRVTWLDDRLPGLPKLAEHRGAFDLILCSAVLIHVPPDQLALSFRTLSRLMSPSGRLIASLRAPAAWDPPNLLFDHDPAGVISAAHDAQLRLIRHVETRDAMGRPDVVWRLLAFERSDRS